MHTEHLWGSKRVGKGHSFHLYWIFREPSIAICGATYITCHGYRQFYVSTRQTLKELPVNVKFVFKNEATLLKKWQLLYSAFENLAHV